jgi:hypothetical protein
MAQLSVTTGCMPNHFCAAHGVVLCSELTSSVPVKTAAVAIAPLFDRHASILNHTVNTYPCTGCRWPDLMNDYDWNWEKGVYTAGKVPANHSCPAMLCKNVE